MTAWDFCYWLRGFFEMEEANDSGLKRMNMIDNSQAECIKNKLAKVFKDQEKLGEFVSRNLEEE